MFSSFDETEYDFEKIEKLLEEEFCKNYNRSN
jgi:hypothetical protein